MRTMTATILTLLVVSASGLAGPPAGRHHGGGHGMMRSGGPAGRQGPGGGGAMRGEPGMSVEEHGPIFDLLSGHDTIIRVVKEIPGGVRTTTTTKKPELVGTLRTHVRQMARRLESGRPVRIWDPVFRQIFAHADEIVLTFKEIDGGIEVTETSKNPAVVPIIRAHAAKLNTFVAKGHEAARPPWAGGGRGRTRPDQ